MYHLLKEGGTSSIGDLIIAATTGVIDANEKMKRDDRGAKDYSYSSIAKAASKLVAVFPILASRTVSGETTQMVSKYIEQKACNLFTLALQAANIDNARNGIEYLRHYHQNLDIGGDTVNAVVKTMDDWIAAYKGIKESANSIALDRYADNVVEEDCIDLFECDRELEINPFMLQEVMNLLKENENAVFYDTKLNPISINDFIVDESAGNYHVSIRKYDSLTEAKKPVPASGLRTPYAEEAKRRADIEAARRGINQNSDDYIDLLNRYRAEQKRIQDDRDADSKYINDEKDRNLRNKEHGEDRAYELAKRRQAKDDKERSDKEHAQDREWTNYQRDRQKRDNYRDDLDYNTRRTNGNNVEILRNQDIKKMNDAIPSLLVVRFYNDSNASVATEFIVGVKSKVIPVTTAEILRRIMNDNKDGKKFLNIMRVITGELKAADVIFGLSRINDDLMSTRKKGAQGDTWELLKTRAAAAKKQLAKGQRNDFSAITTVLISQADADELFREENFDITNPKNAKHFMDSYNIISFIIADDATETLNILFDDGSKEFEEISYRMLERETQDGTYKKLINLMASSR